MEHDELVKFIEDNISYHMSEFDLEREEAEDVVTENLIWWYYSDDISRDDLINGAAYLGYVIDMDAADKEKAIRKHRKELREARKRRKQK